MLIEVVSKMPFIAGFQVVAQRCKFAIFRHSITPNKADLSTYFREKLTDYKNLYARNPSTCSFKTRPTLKS